MTTADQTSFTAEASELGLAPGYWPATIRYTPDDQPPTTFAFFGYDHDAEGEVVSVTYLDIRDRRLVVWND